MLALFTAACGDNDFGEAPHTPLPQVTTAGGPVIASPRFAVITFPGDPLASDIEQFAAQLGTSDYWSTVVSEYGVGPASVVPVRVTDPAPATIDDPGIQNYLIGHLNPVANGWPKPDGNTIYALFYPAATTFTECSSIAGYHLEIPLPDGTYAPFLVVPRCTYNGIVPVDEVTEVSTHEFAEATTDLFPATAPAYDTASDLAWAQWRGGQELGDMCSYTYGEQVFEPALAHYVERIWSNAEAAAGHDPCVPHPSGDVYFQAAPEATDMINVTFGFGTPIASTGLHIPLHQSRTVDVQLFSDAATAPISVSAREWPINAKAEEPAGVVTTLDRTSGGNGDTLHLTITVNADNAGEGHQYIVLTSQVGDIQQSWPVQSLTDERHRAMAVLCTPLRMLR